MQSNRNLPPALQGLLQKASEHRSGGDQLVFMGSLQDPVPRHLIIDPDLPASAVRIWAYFRSHITSMDGSIKCPTYVEIMRDLSIGSRETVAVHLSLLRATRWLSLAARTKDERGFTRGNIYALHTQPISVADAIVLDEEYMGLLIKLSQHQNPKYHRLALSLITNAEQFFDQQTTTPSLDAIEESLVADQVTTSTRASPLRRFYQRPVTNQQPAENVTPLKQGSGTIISSAGVATNLESGDLPFKHKNTPSVPINQLGHTVATETENQSTIIVPPEYDNRTAFCSSSSSNINPTTTTNNSNQKNHSSSINELLNQIDFHDDILKFNDNLKALAAKSLIRIGSDDQQMVLDCVAAQVKMAKFGQGEPVRVPVRYIQWHVGKIIDGENSLSGIHPDDVRAPENTDDQKQQKLRDQEEQRKLQEEALKRAHDERIERLLEQKEKEKKGDNNGN